MKPKLVVAIRTAVFSFIVCAAISCQQKPANKPTEVRSIDSSATLIHNDNFDGVIFTAEKRALDETTKYWTPSETDVMEAEKQLVPFLQSLPPNPYVYERDHILKNLKNYKRQYVGVITNGKKELFINFLCNESVAEDEKLQKELCEEHHDCTHVLEWTHDLVVVMDGGPCFFQIYYSIESKSFSRFSVNGAA